MTNDTFSMTELYGDRGGAQKGVIAYFDYKVDTITEEVNGVRVPKKDEEGNIIEACTLLVNIIMERKGKDGAPNTQTAFPMFVNGLPLPKPGATLGQASRVDEWAMKKLATLHPKYPFLKGDPGDTLTQTIVNALNHSYAGKQMEFETKKDYVITRGNWDEDKQRFAYQSSPFSFTYPVKILGEVTASKQELREMFDRLDAERKAKKAEEDAKKAAQKQEESMEGMDPTALFLFLIDGKTIEEAKDAAVNQRSLASADFFGRILDETLFQEIQDKGYATIVDGKLKIREGLLSA